MGRRYAGGDNYEATIDGPVAMMRVWRRPDLSFERGAVLAAEVASHLQDFAEGKAPGVTAIILDITAAPEHVGKKTREAVGFVLTRCETLGIRLALVISTNTQAVIMDHVVARNGVAPEHVRVVRDVTEALAWVRG